MSSTTCPNCGVPITADDRFCSNCGARLNQASSAADQDTIPPIQSPESTPVTESGSQEPVIPTLGRKNAWEYERDRVQSVADEDEWRMSDLGPPPPRKRRTWLWIVI